MLASRVLGAIKSIDPTIDRKNYLATSRADLEVMLDFANSIATGPAPLLCDIDARRLAECVICSLFGTRYTLGECFTSWPPLLLLLLLLRLSLLSVPARWPQRRRHGQRIFWQLQPAYGLRRAPGRGWTR
jgi:hypothetical protein